MSHHDVPIPAEPPPIAVSGAVRGAAAVAALAGAAAFAWALLGGHAGLAWSGYLIGAFFALGLGVFGVLWIAILYLSKAVWSVTMRRIPEAMTAWILPGGILAGLVMLGGHDLYHWTHTEAVQSDALLKHKAPFLNTTLFAALVGGSIVVWLLFGTLIVGNSRKQDRTGSAALSRVNAGLSAGFTVIYALTFSAASYYFLMSLDAHWFSTMYGVLMFTDMVQTGTAFVAIVAGILILRGQLQGFLNENHLHSLAKMMFAATGFWAYIYFCQFLLIWYGNLPEETFYFLNRWENGWLPYLLILPAIKFVIPFVIMVPRENKRQPKRVITMAALLIVAQFWELFLLVSPSVSHDGAPAHAHLPIVEVLVCLGFLGLFVLVFVWALQRHPAVPLKDPLMRECLQYHQ